VLTRFVSADGDAHALYHVSFSVAHPDRIALATVSIGEWGEGSDAGQRTALAVELRPGEGEYAVRILDAAASPWRDSTVLGRTLDRDEALRHPRLPDFYAVIDLALAEDAELRAYLDGDAT
jgi:hypothetical protein